MSMDLDKKTPLFEGGVGVYAANVLFAIPRPPRTEVRFGPL